MSTDERRPDDLPPAGWMSRPPDSAAFFRQHHEESMHSYIQAATSMQYRGIVLPYQYDVLSIANDFLAAGKPDVAVLMAQTACEIATEAVISQLLRYHSFPSDVEKWMRSRVGNQSTFNQSALYELYRALSGDDFKNGKQKLWQDWNAHIAIRNDIAHKGRHATEAQARRYCEIALEVIHHFEGVLARVTAK